MNMLDVFKSARQSMIDQQLRARGIYDPRVLDAMRAVPRHEFIPETLRGQAYADRALPIGDDQTISQPYIVALMLQSLRLRGHEQVLEIGTGSGYQTALLSRLAGHVYTLECLPRLAGTAASTLYRLGCENVDVHVGDGSQGLPDMSPFDCIVVSAAAPSVPGPLRAQLRADGGRMVIPVGDADNQVLELVVRQGERWEFKRVAAVRFVPLVGRYGFAPGQRDNNSASVG
jgi:protein-L-isoaspartate(D-aspartate) O-methyltransferase